MGWSTTAGLKHFMSSNGMIFISPSKRATALSFNNDISNRRWVEMKNKIQTRKTLDGMVKGSYDPTSGTCCALESWSQSEQNMHMQRDLH